MTIVAPVLIYLLGSAQPAPQAVQTRGACSPVVTGNNNSFNITCQGISEKLGVQLVDLLNRLAKNQADAEEIMAKLDGCLDGVKEVREEQRPWNLTAGQKQELMKWLTTKAKASMHVEHGDRNAALMAQDLASVLSDAGWDLQMSNSVGLIPPAAVGVAILWDHENPQRGQGLVSALRAVGIQAVGWQPGVGDALAGVVEPGRITILVGAKPAGAGKAPSVAAPVTDVPYRPLRLVLPRSF